jgi:hypothetical protein
LDVQSVCCLIIKKTVPFWRSFIQAPPLAKKNGQFNQKKNYIFVIKMKFHTRGSGFSLAAGQKNDRYNRKRYFGMMKF